MLKPQRISFVVLIAAILAAAVWLLLRPADPMFHGKRESVWVKEIVYRGGDAQTKQWREFGPDGIAILARSLDQGNDPITLTYLECWRRLPPRYQAWFPQPANHYDLRMRVVDTLFRLHGDAKYMLPVFMRSLRTEPNGPVRAIVIAALEGYLPELDEQQKRELLPYFLRALKSRDDSEVNNAAIVLRFYRAQADVVAPALIPLLKDARPNVRLMAARSLDDLDPRTAETAGVVPAVIACLTNTDEQIGVWAARSLGEMKLQPELAVPALIAIAQGSNFMTAQAAVEALGDFKEQSATIVPVLEKASKVRMLRRSAAIALKNIGAPDDRK